MAEKVSQLPVYVREKYSSPISIITIKKITIAIILVIQNISPLILWQAQKICCFVIAMQTKNLSQVL